MKNNITPEIAILLAFAIQESGQAIISEVVAESQKLTEPVTQQQALLSGLQIVAKSTTNEHLKELAEAIADLVVVDEGENAVDDFKTVINVILDAAKAAKEARKTAKED